MIRSIIILASLVLTTALVAANESATQTGTSLVPLVEHPALRLLDANGENVLISRRPVSTMRTCGGCHDTEFIATHNYHATAGLDEWREPGNVPGGHSWDSSPGNYGRWNPLLYRYLTPTVTIYSNEETMFDLGTADWVRLFGKHHTGGGPAMRSHDGARLDTLNSDTITMESHILDPTSGHPVAWDWKSSGVAEFNCFLCHLANPDNEERTRELHNGKFKWAATATLMKTGLVSPNSNRWRWNDTAFDKDGFANMERLRIIAPSSAHCGQCHGLVHHGEEPATVYYGSTEFWRTETTGQIFSAQNLFESGINLDGKKTQARPWDIHAERLLSCSNCHFAINNPAYATEADASRPAHLAFDARRLSISKFLNRPNHNFAKGWSANGTVANDIDGTMRRCEDCHDAQAVHDWLPYKNRHMKRLLCESCHVPRIPATARCVTDWTVLTENHTPRVEYRGTEGGANDPAVLVDGYTPVLLPRKDGDSQTARLGPHNLIVTWFWVAGNPTRPVRLIDLKRAYFEGETYHKDIMAVFDTNGNGEIGSQELTLDTAQKVDAVRTRLEQLGIDEPRITGEIQPFGIHHGVVTKGWATRDCRTCHSAYSAINRPFVLASTAPNGILPHLVKDSRLNLPGSITINGSKVVYKPASIESGFYILGYDRWPLIDSFGFYMILGVLAGVILHGGFRWIAARRRRIFR